MDDPSVHLELTASGQSRQGFSDRVYLLASIIFQNNYLEKPVSQRLVNYGEERGLSLPEVKDGEMQHAAYELAFSALKYQELLENILIDSSFYLTQPVPNDQMSLVVVMLYDFQDRKFLPRQYSRAKEFINEVRDVETYLLRLKAKLAASLARWRIKHELLSIECMLPESVKIKHRRASNLLLHAWVNTLKSSLDEVQSVLKGAGFSRVRSIDQLEGKTFCQDPHCEDILVFPAQMKAQLDSTKLLSNHKLIVQDKSCCLGPNAVFSLLQEARGGDVLMAGCFSGLTVSHTASLISMKQKRSGKDKSKLFLCVGDRTKAQMQELQQVITTMGCKNVKLLPSNFRSLDRGNKLFRKVCVILLTPKCSLSAISNPVEFILKENGDTDLLQDLALGSIAQSRLEALVLQQKSDIDHAMRFPKISSVIYTTYSSYPEENEEVVRAVFEQTKGCGESGRSQTSLPPFSSPFDSENLLFTLPPTEQSNGCFMAILTRKPVQDVKEPTTEVPAEVTKSSKKPQRERAQAPHTKARKRQTKSSNIGASIKKNLLPKFKESQKLLLSRVNTQSPQQSPNTECRRKSDNWNKTDVRPRPRPREVKASTERVLPKTNATGLKESSKLEHYGKPTSLNKIVHPYQPPRDVHKPTVISLPQVDFPALFPPPAHSKGIWAQLQQTQVKALAHKVLHTRSNGGEI